MSKTIEQIKFILRYVGTRNWYEGVDKPNLFQWLYKWRIGFKTANELYKICKK